MDGNHEVTLKDIEDFSKEMFLNYELLTAHLIELGYLQIEANLEENEDLIPLADSVLDALENVEKLISDLNLLQKSTNRDTEVTQKTGLTTENERKSLSEKFLEINESGLLNFQKNPKSQTSASHQSAGTSSTIAQGHFQQSPRRSSTEAREKLKQNLAKSLYKRIQPHVIAHNPDLQL